MIIKDKVISGVIVGLLADTVKLFINYILYLFKLTPVVFWQIAATRFLDKEDIYKPIAYFIGGVADITVSALLGIVFVYMIYIVGSKYLLLKGIGFGLLVWVSIFGTLLGESVKGKIPQEPAGIIVTIIAHFFFGVSLAFFTRRFLKITRA